MEMMVIAPAIAKHFVMLNMTGRSDVWTYIREVSLIWLLRQL